MQSTRCKSLIFVNDYEYCWRNLQNTSKWINQLVKNEEPKSVQTLSPSQCQLKLKLDIQILAYVEDYANHGGTKNWKDIKSKLHQELQGSLSWMVPSWQIRNDKSVVLCNEH
ncbi:hypothetical protein AMTRI_Chr05g70340 [Amborella trichopoda]|uniref:uncharacterized protein LOC105421474 n=1 Tax=Amborella trichopoda TaxID=13333 RepID=UPI0005D3E664|nr:uncharacterized protein LOC105421474 [Amborella trichopoda]|eukprot:XP_011627244.1 uncharacterized protein LOC105421474 [Amborella trichopoda]